MSPLEAPSRQEVEEFLNEPTLPPAFRRQDPRITVETIEPFDDGGFFRRHLILEVRLKGPRRCGKGLLLSEHRGDPYGRLIAWDGTRLSMLSSRVNPRGTSQDPSNSWRALAAVLHNEQRPLSEADPRRLAALVAKGPLGDVQPISIPEGTMPSAGRWAPLDGRNVELEWYRDCLAPVEISSDNASGWTLSFNTLVGSILEVHRVHQSPTGSLKHSSRSVTKSFRSWVPPEPVGPETPFRPIVFVDGDQDLRATEMLFGLLIQDVREWTVPTANGLFGARKAARMMKSVLESSSQLMPVFALVDSETAASLSDPQDDVVGMPVATMENLLLDTDAIWDLVAPFQITGLDGEPDVSASFRSLAEDRRREEIDVRMRAFLHDQTVPPTSPFARHLSAVVDAILAEDRHLEMFQGPALIKAFYERHRLEDSGMSRYAFVIELARRAAGRERVGTLTRSAIDRIRFFMPASLAGLLDREAVTNPEAAEVASLVRAERASWERGEPHPELRSELRARVFSVVLQAVSERRQPYLQLLSRVAAAIGTPA